MRNWLIAFGLCCLAIVLSIRFVDVPVARFLHTMPWQEAMHVSAFDIPVLIGACGILLVGFAIQKSLGGQIRGWEETALLIVLSLSWGVSVTVCLLKPLFGRPMPYVFFANGNAEFHYWRWALDNSFPSGHAVQIASVTTVLWMAYPGLRVLWAASAAMGYLLLILGNWHFVSDVIAGGFLGTLSAAVIVTLWRTRQSAN